MVDEPFCEALEVRRSAQHQSMVSTCMVCSFPVRIAANCGVGHRNRPARDAALAHSPHQGTRIRG